MIIFNNLKICSLNKLNIFSKYELCKWLRKIRNLFKSRQKNLTVYVRMYVFSLSLNFVSYRNSKSSLEQAFCLKLIEFRQGVLSRDFFSLPLKIKYTFVVFCLSSLTLYFPSLKKKIKKEGGRGGRGKKERENANVRSQQLTSQSGLAVTALHKDEKEAASVCSLLRNSSNFCFLVMST